MRAPFPALIVDRLGAWIPEFALRVPRIAQEWAALLWTAASVALMAMALAYASGDALAMLTAALIWVAGTALGLWSFLGCAHRIDCEGRDCARISALARAQRAMVLADQMASTTRELASLKRSFEDEFGADPNRQREAVAVARDIYMEAQHRRFAHPAALADQVETARPELTRVLRLIQVQALRAGILCTFIGLLIGLQDFRAEASSGQEQVAQLLGGLRRGFGASIAGLLVAVWAGFLAQLLVGRQVSLRAASHRMATDLVEVVSRAAQSDEFYREVPQVTEAMRMLRTEIGQSLHETRKELAGAGAAFAETPRRWEQFGRLAAQQAEAIARTQTESAGSLARHAAALERLAGHAERALGQTVAALESQGEAMREVGARLSGEIRSAYSADTVQRVQGEAAAQAREQIAAMAASVAKVDQQMGLLRRSVGRGVNILAALLAGFLVTVLGLALRAFAA